MTKLSIAVRYIMQSSSMKKKSEKLYGILFLTNEKKYSKKSKKIRLIWGNRNENKNYIISGVGKTQNAYEAMEKNNFAEKREHRLRGAIEISENNNQEYLRSYDKIMQNEDFITPTEEKEWVLNMIEAENFKKNIFLKSFLIPLVLVSFLFPLLLHEMSLAKESKESVKYFIIEIFMPLAAIVIPMVSIFFAASCRRKYPLIAD